MPVVHHLTTLGLAACLLAPAAVTVPVVQAASMRFVTPRLTLTMVDRSVDAVLSGDSPQIHQTYLPLEQAGELPRAVVSSEDGQFFVHGGFDWNGICAAWKSNQEGGRLRGGSTITQQTARNLFLFQRRSWVRKGLEVVYTLALEAVVPKERILELYVNIAETGDRQFGFQQAARQWFDKDVEQLRMTEVGRLVYLLPNPRERSANGRSAKKKAQWIQRNLAPLPGEQGHVRLQDRWEGPSWPPCP